MAWRAVVRWRFLLQSGLDSCAWAVALCAATWLRFEFAWGTARPMDLFRVALVAAIFQVALGSLAGLYVHRWRYGVLEEVAALTRTFLTVTVLITGFNWLFIGRHRIPVSATLVAGVLGLLLAAGGRFVWRIGVDRTHRPDGSAAEPIIVFGAGEGGTQVIKAMLSSRTSPYYPVALLDDDARFRKLSIKGVRVRGDRHAISSIAAETDATTLLIAIPSATGELLRELEALATEAGLQTAVLPPVSELFGAGIGVADIRPIAEEDLLGRRVLDTDIESVAGYLADRRVLVTGAGGSIGSELCRQITRFGPAQLVMLDRDESALQAVQLSIEGQGLLDSDELVVADIRDADRMAEVFERFRPQVVFHAAALKHLTLLERNPEEGHKTNVVGTQNLLEISGRFGVDVFVNISTDKAADPSSVLGRTKRLAERLTAHAAGAYDGTYLSVRFGNVLGSRGSVLPLFQAQIASGGPVTVTHPDVTRYFMTIPEACELVVQAGAIGTAGHVMVLDMGAPVRIDDVARRLIAESDRPIEIVYTGLRPGEKLCESLFGATEVAVGSKHPLIWSVEVEPIDPIAAGVDSPRPALVVDLRASSAAAKGEVAAG